jgi:NAD(P)H-dependent flavin oxidoreductase YrpB (nitropropane dioxygenase family)
MAGVSTPELAAAVSNSGGLGSLGLGAATVSQAEALIARTRNLTTGPSMSICFAMRRRAGTRTRKQGG